jgi:hypothetical protein
MLLDSGFGLAAAPEGPWRVFGYPDRMVFGVAVFV